MNDFAISENAIVQAQLNRLSSLPLPQGKIGLETVKALCARVGNPEKKLPPVFHVAGTNGKGSTCTFLRAILEASGLTVHTATKPHLVRYNERIRLAGQLIKDDLLAELLKEILDVSQGLAPSFFEVTTVATFLAFSRVAADVCVIETGLGGRLDATNVIPAPAVCGIASLGIDHKSFLLSPDADVPVLPIARIAFEKAGIAKRGVPLVTQAYGSEASEQIARVASEKGAILQQRGISWDCASTGAMAYWDTAGMLSLPFPTLVGAHQVDNAALAVAMLRHQAVVPVEDEAIRQGIAAAHWPARLQLLGPGPLTDLVDNRAVWLDGGHNADAGAVIGRHFRGTEPVHLVIGMLAAKDPAAIIAPLLSCVRSISVVAPPGHEAHGPNEFARFTNQPIRSFANVSDALAALPERGDILIAGSLYLAGEVLRLNRQIPD